MKWPNGKKFAFTFIDDTDHSFIDNTKPIYDLFTKLGIFGTKTFWVYPPRDHFTGYSLQDPEYRNYLIDLRSQGHELALHGIGSGHFSRDEILKGLIEYENILGEKPKMHINHSQNTSNIYWGKNRLPNLARSILQGIKGKEKKFQGEKIESECFWGDWVKANIVYTRNWHFNDVNTLKMDPKMPYREKSKNQFSNFWFSSSNGNRLDDFQKLISKENIDKLENEGGLCIVYTHLGTDFCTSPNFTLNSEFVSNLESLSKRNCWFAPASTILDYLQEEKMNKNEYANSLYLYGLILKKYLLKK